MITRPFMSSSLPIINPDERDRLDATIQEIQEAVHEIRKKAPNAGGACDAIDRNVRNVAKLFEEIRQPAPPLSKAM